MNLLMKWMRGSPTRDLVRAVVVLSLAGVAMESWLDGLAELGRSDFGKGMESGGFAFFLAMTAWGVWRDPVKWGFRVGVVGLIALGLALALLGLLLAGMNLRPDHPVSEMLRAVPAWGWITGALQALAMAAVAVAAISLRWLFRRPPPEA